ncbi:hypothetical protein CERZMDRAFT_93196 [Cercospora zeae-maydis SCOH1-5]|uniref:Uncharacterized protein n=1 Tax=Cercospora zeae-maydis SCOH1-5 TaxID=717836 RepID=A0A6A6FUT8_9PEZI|nr:hypothetical protein CERZMDRAFT_93196 [Cercospora zeae-maydis SCOH1-5]
MSTTFSDSLLAADTDLDTVMAEQTGHNVVINSESTGAAAPVDTAANASTTNSALSGKTNSNSLPDASNAATTSGSPTQPNGPTSGNAGSDAPLVAAEPSAGEAADRAALKPADAKTTSNDKSRPAHGDLVNGVHEDGSQADAHADDKSMTGVSVDLSVNSDTDNSKADAGEKGGHTRTNSTVKKPAAFSKVNATKSFLSKIAPSAPATPQTGDKGEKGKQSAAQSAANPKLASSASVTLQPASRPRLIAKTGSSQSMLKPRAGPGGSGAPDASKVWNKNQPVAAPPPKQLTDEELKQQFGIHLATRLQTDGDKKDSNWADIDDDEDDWAPETVVWMDGTKSTVPKDATPAPVEEPQKPTVQPATKPAEGVKPTLSVKQRSDRPEHPMRILKPGAAATQQKQNGAASAASPANSKSPLTSKSPAPAPAKSPWAPVPKPDTVAPINPPVQAPPPQRTLLSQDARASEPMGYAPAREIAADTFDRSWQQRDGGARELFNSSNGRYEPAPEGRRGSMRQDNARKPAVLQRPSQALSPAPEPSPAFQSRSSSQMDGSWASRRRGSSVSQGSMPPPRRMSMNRSDFGATPEAASGPGRADRARPNFNQSSAWDKQMPPPPPDAQQAPEGEPAPPLEDPVKIQERIMQEKREAAKRRKEEEAREEAERKERLKAKLAALEGAGKSRSERAAEAAAKTSERQNEKQTQKQVEKPAEAAKPTASLETLPAKPSASANAPSTSPAIVETPAPAQQPTEKPIASSEPQPALAGLPSREDQNRAEPAASRPPTSRAPFGQQPPVYRAPASSYSSPGERKSQPAQLGRSPVANNDAFSPWPTTTSSNNNIWGSGFGNGVFEGGSAFAPMATSQQNSSLPPPPGMSRASASARIPPQGFSQDSRSPNLGQPQITEQQRAFPAPGMTDRSMPFGPAQPRLTGVSPQHAPGFGRPHPPGPIGPPSRTQTQIPQQQAQQPQPPPEIAAWKAAANTMHQQYHAPPPASNAAASNEPLPEHRFKETFKKTSAEQGKLGGPRRYDSIEHTIHDGAGSRTVSNFSPAPPNTQTQPIAPPPAASPAQDARVNTAIRMPDPSRNPAHVGLPRPIEPPHRRHAERLQQQQDLAAVPLAPNVSSKEQFAPPPEIESHPVFEGNSRQPQVKLPKPQPQVRLPPPSPSATSPQTQSRHNGSVVMPQRHSFRQPFPGAQQPIVANEQWQQRFNGLFGRAEVSNEAPPSPPKTPPKSQGPSLAVASSSIEPMATQTGGATVSLPQGEKAQHGRIKFEPTSKPEIDFSNERSFGSLPVVKVPRAVRYAAHVDSAHPNNLLKMALAPKFPKTMETGYREEIFFWRNPAGIFVKILNTPLNNRLCYSPNQVSQQSRQGRNERKNPPSQPRKPQALGSDQQLSEQNNRKQHRAAEPQTGLGHRKSSHTSKVHQQAPRNPEDRKASAKSANKKFESRENAKTAANEAIGATTTGKTSSGPSSKRNSVQVAKDQKPSTPPPAKSTPMSAKEATTEKRKSGVSKAAGTPSASANRFDLLAAMGSPSKN